MSTAAERMRLVRQRHAAGTVLVRLALSAEGVADLIALGWLKPDAPRKDVPAALVSLLDTAMEARVKPARDLSLPTETWPGVGR
jgi:hypothetical protein